MSNVKVNFIRITIYSYQLDPRNKNKINKIV